MFYAFYKMPPAIPDRWIPYKPCGKVIEGTRIICFKVPLRKTVQAGNSEIKEIWDIKALLEKIPNLGAVIDLTNTNRYYNPKELQDAGKLYSKILMPGRVIPPEDKVQQFMDTVDEFLGKDCESLIGVHCTHGLNRTGYMVCRYMRDRLQIPAKTAIKRFEKARGYKIERENYLADLLGEEPPPADLGKDTKLKPITSKKRISENGNIDSYKKRKTSAINNCKKDSSEGNWRSEARSDQNWRSEAGRSDDNSKHWKQNRRHGENSKNWRRKKTDSESSYDFKYDY